MIMLTNQNRFGIRREHKGKSFCLNTIILNHGDRYYKCHFYYCQFSGEVVTHFEKCVFVQPGRWFGLFWVPKGQYTPTLTHGHGGVFKNNLIVLDYPNRFPCRN